MPFVAVPFAPLRTSLLVVALFFALATPSQAAISGSTSTTLTNLPAAQTQDCSRVQASMAANGAPSAQARLLASHDAPQQQVGQPVTDIYIVKPGDTLSNIAARFETTVASIMERNALTNPNFIWSGQRLYIPGAAIVAATAGVLPAPLSGVWADGNPIQGEAALIWLRASPGTTVSGTLRGWEGEQYIPFYRHCDLLWGLVAFDALRDTAGIYNLNLRAKTSDGRVSAVTVPVTLSDGSYPMSEIMEYPSDREGMRDPNVIRAENQRLNTLFAGLPYSPPRWVGTFRMPLDSYITNIFGYRGAVNGVPQGYHEGIDLRARTPTYVPSAAAGVVVLAENLTVRGGTVFIDHGAGVVSGYFHMSRLDVKVGDYVEIGDYLGLTGATGLVTGPHLHWEMRVNGRWVNPMLFVRRAFP